MGKGRRDAWRQEGGSRPHTPGASSRSLHSCPAPSPFHLQISPLTSTPFLLLCLLSGAPASVCCPLNIASLPSLFHSHGAWPTPSLLGSRLRVLSMVPPAHVHGHFSASSALTLGVGVGKRPSPTVPITAIISAVGPLQTSGSAFPPPLCGPLRGGGHILLFLPPDSLLNLFCSFSSFTWPRVQALMMGMASSLFSSLLLPTCHPCHPPNHSIHPSCRDQSHFLKQTQLSLPADSPTSLPSTSRAESLPLASPLRPFRVDLHLPFHVHPTVHLMHPTPSPGGKVPHFPSSPSPLGPPLPSNAVSSAGKPFLFSPSTLAYSFLKVQAKCLFFDRDFPNLQWSQDEATVAKSVDTSTWDRQGQCGTLAACRPCACWERH